MKALESGQPSEPREMQFSEAIENAKKFALIYLNQIFKNSQSHSNELAEDFLSQIFTKMNLYVNDPDLKNIFIQTFYLSLNSNVSERLRKKKEDN